MAVTVKSEHEIQLMREAGAILAKVHTQLKDALRPGMSTLEIDEICEELIRSCDCIPSFLGYEGFPGSACVSVNEEVVHGIPSEEKIIHEGDIVSIDTGVIWKGWQSDAARTWAIGKISPEAEKLNKAAEGAFFAGMKFARAGMYLNDICTAIGEYAESRGYGVIRELTGHGIGSEMHEDPDIPNFRMNKRGILLRKGMTLAIEPMITLGSPEIEWTDDEWTVVTRDGSLASHYENTILITDGEPEILSL